MTTFEAIAAALRRTHGLSVTSVERVPGGYAAECYDVRTENGRYFLKTWPDTERGRRNAAKQPRALAVAKRLAEPDWAQEWRGPGGAFAVAPLPSLDDSLLNDTANGVPFALFPFIEAAEVTEAAAINISTIFGAMLAKLHEATPLVRHLLAPADPYDLSVVERLRGCTGRLQRATAGERPAIGSLRSVLIAHEDEIERQIRRLRDVHARVVVEDVEFVVCHRDFGLDNVLFVAESASSGIIPDSVESTDDGVLGTAVVDWDDVELAPPEHDLASVATDLDRPAVEPVIDGELYVPSGIEQLQSAILIYWGQSQHQARFSLDQFEFALVRRALEDITARLFVILDDSRSSDEDTLAVFGIEAYGFARWETLDATLASIREIITAMGTSE